MSKSILLNIPEPCHENWQQMTPLEQGRFCGSCQKIVVDFSVMTDKEVLDYFSKASQHVCGRFSSDQLNKEITVTPAKKRVTWLYVWNLILATLLMTKTYAQGKPQIKKPAPKTTICEKRTMGEIVQWPEPADAIIPVNMKGMVLDAQTNQPVSGVSIYVKGTQNGTMADSEGKFLLRAEKKAVLELEVSSIGYETQTITLDKTADWGNLRVVLKPAATELQEVSVIAPHIVGRLVKMECVKQVEVTELKKIQQAVTDLFKKDIKVYPNPVVRGNNIQVKLKLPQTGQYRLELLNTAGQVMLIQPLFMQTKEQQIDLYTQAKWSAGMYWVRITSTKLKDVFEARVLLQ